LARQVRWVAFGWTSRPLALNAGKSSNASSAPESCASASTSSAGRARFRELQQLAPTGLRWSCLSGSPRRSSGRSRADTACGDAAGSATRFAIGPGAVGYRRRTFSRGELMADGRYEKCHLRQGAGWQPTSLTRRAAAHELGRGRRGVSAGLGCGAAPS